MELATITSNGQITLPKGVCDDLRVKAGDKIIFLRSKNGYEVANAGKVSLRELQDGFDGVAEKWGVESLDDVVTMVKEHRRKNANLN